MAKLLRPLCVLVFGLLMPLASVAQADDFVPIPEGGSGQENLKMRVVRYDGGTNGEMVIEVTNTGKRAATFVAEGIFFVPKGNPESAPQRLGAAGPILELAGRNKGKRSEKVAVAGGTTKQLRLDVFCIDSHRSSPNSSTAFRIAKGKLPKKLRREITRGNKRILKENKGSMGAAKSSIQSHMWSTRDKDWVPLEGERAQEKKPRSNKRPHRNRLNRPLPDERQFAQPPPMQQQQRR